MCCVTSRKAYSQAPSYQLGFQHTLTHQCSITSELAGRFGAVLQVLSLRCCQRQPKLGKLPQILLPQIIRHQPFQFVDLRNLLLKILPGDKTRQQNASPYTLSTRTTPTTSPSHKTTMFPPRVPILYHISELGLQTASRRTRPNRSYFSA